MAMLSIADEFEMENLLRQKTHDNFQSVMGQISSIAHEALLQGMSDLRSFRFNPSRGCQVQLGFKTGLVWLCIVWLSRAPRREGGGD